jgi:xanthine/uracil permease
MPMATRPEVREGYFPHWQLRTAGVILPDERLPWGQTIVSGLQHGVAMAGGTIIAPLLMGFDPNRALLFSGVGTIGGYLLYLLLANGFGLGKSIDFTALAAASWIGLPRITGPTFHADAMFLIAPVAIILVAENLGHIKAIGAMTGRSLDSFLGRAFLGDSLATIVSAFGGGTGVTTYAENIGVMAATKIYSTLLFVVAAIVSVLLGFSPKFGALILSIPDPVIGGLSIVLFGLIAAMAGRIWVENKVDFSDPRNLITVAAALTAGAGDLTLKFGGFAMGGIGTATFGAIIFYQVLAWTSTGE